MNTPPEGQARRRPLVQFSLRTLIVVMLLAGCGLGWVAMNMRRASAQRQAVERLQKLGATVLYEYESEDDGKAVAGAAPPAATWLRRMLGDDYFDRVVSVDFVGTRIDDSALRNLDALPDLEFLNLSGQSISDDGLIHLRGLKRLRVLDLWGAKVSDTGVAHLRPLKNLETLLLGGTLVGDQGVAELVRHSALTRLHLSFTRVSDAGLQSLHGHKQLQTLTLYGADASAAGIERLRAQLPDCNIGYYPRPETVARSRMSP